MAAVLLLLLVILARESLQQGALEQFQISRDACANETAEILRELDRLQQPEFRCEGQEESLGRSLGALQSSMEEQFASVNSTMAMELRNNQEKEAERAKQHQMQLQEVALQLEDVVKNKTIEEFRKAQVEVEMTKIELKAMLSEMQAWIGSEIRSLKQQVESAAEKGSFCYQWKAKLGGLALKKLGTGVYHYNEINYLGNADANAWCKARGMRLAVVETQQELQTLVQHATQKWYWVGASDASYSPGDFRWSDGQRVAADLWRSDEPDSYGAGKATCVRLQVASGANKFQDISCTDDKNYPLCEVETEHLFCL